jgi:hypothetical protein
VWILSLDEEIVKKGMAPPNEGTGGKPTRNRFENRHNSYTQNVTFQPSSNLD